MTGSYIDYYRKKVQLSAKKPSERSPILIISIPFYHKLFDKIIIVFFQGFAVAWMLIMKGRSHRIKKPGFCDSWWFS